jgi:hypothetical protein
MKNALTAAALLVCLSLAASQDSSIRDAMAAELPIPPRGEVSIQGYADKNKLCQEWTDGCRTCTRPESGDAVCSNPGIACQPKAISCTRRAEQKK